MFAALEHLISVNYDLDEEDAEFIANYNKAASKKITEDHFETLVDQLEKLSKISDGLASLQDVQQSLTGALAEAASALYEYWKDRRIRRAAPLMPTIRTYSSKLNDQDPYICFRRRDSKFNRKTRRSEQQCLERMQRLREDFERVENLLGMLLKRDKFKRDLLLMEQRVFEKKLVVREWKRQQLLLQYPNGIPPNLEKLKKPSGTKLRISINGGAIKARISSDPSDRKLPPAKTEEEIRRQQQFFDCTDVSFVSIPRHPRRKMLEYTDIALGRFGPQLLHARRRIGRGNRVLFDVRRVPMEPVSERKRARFEVSDEEEEDDEDTRPSSMPGSSAIDLYAMVESLLTYTNPFSSLCGRYKFLSVQDFSMYNPLGFLNVAQRKPAIIYTVNRSGGTKAATAAATVGTGGGPAGAAGAPAGPTPIKKPKTTGGKATHSDVPQSGSGVPLSKSLGTSFTIPPPTRSDSSHGKSSESSTRMVDGMGPTSTAAAAISKAIGPNPSQPPVRPQQNVS